MKIRFSLSILTLITTSSGFADTLTIITTDSAGVEQTKILTFDTEEQCQGRLKETAEELSGFSLPDNIGYSIDPAPDFIERRWDEFLTLLTGSIFDESDSPVYYGRSFDFSGFPSMHAWGSPAEEPKAQTPEAEPFFHLRLTIKDKKNIAALLTDLADKSYLQLLAGRTSMNRKGERAKLVHPLRFIGYILFDRYLHSCLAKIERDGIKYKEFVNGFESHMQEMAAKEDLSVYVPGFSQLLQIDPEPIGEWIRSGQYGLIIKNLL